MFEQKLANLNSAKSKPGSWLFVSYDQLTDKLGPLSSDLSTGVVMVESHSFLSRRPYHKQKLALLLTNMRHFALEQAEKGRVVEYRITDNSFRKELNSFSREVALELSMMEPAEYETRKELQGSVQFLLNESWLTSLEDLQDSHKKGSPFRMDQFYRHVRKRTGILMDKGKPLGGKYSFDTENRKPWRGEPEAPELPVFPLDSIKREVESLINEKFSHHPGALDLVSLPGTAEDAKILWEWVKDNCLVHFGAYEDAMSIRSTGLFHSRASSLINILRLTPRQVIEDLLASNIPLNSKEGFIRQVLGWREFVRLIHLVTEGFRKIEGKEIEIEKTPGDGGYKSWAGAQFPPRLPEELKDTVDGGSLVSHFGACRKLPPAYWGVRSGLNCLDTVVENVWTESYSHHITRLMVLSNIATLLDISPRQLTDWFWIAYTDAYDWVVEPNVIGMGSHAAGEIMTTKPYISGANYINKMSDYCERCDFDPAKNCPLIRLYWAFLERHKEKLADNIRLRMPLNSLSKRSEKDKEEDYRIFERVSEALEKGKRLIPGSLEQEGRSDV